MKRFPHAGLAILVVLSFGLSAAIVAGAVSLLGPSTRAGAVLARVASGLVPHGATLRASRPALTGLVAAASAYGSSIGDSDESAWALVEPDHDGQTTVAAAGRHPDFDVLTRTDHRPLLWFVHDGEEWVSRDPSVVARAREIIEPMQRIGREMGEVGRRMGARGAAMGRLGGRLGRLGQRLAALETRAAFAVDDEREREELRHEARTVRDEMEAVSARMRDRNDEGDSALRDRMRELQRRQRAAVREARTSMQALIEDAVRDRRAQRLEIGT